MFRSCCTNRFWGRVCLLESRSNTVPSVSVQAGTCHTPSLQQYSCLRCDSVCTLSRSGGGGSPLPKYPCESGLYVLLLASCCKLVFTFVCVIKCFGLTKGVLPLCLCCGATCGGLYRGFVCCLAVSRYPRILINVYFLYLLVA